MGVAHHDHLPLREERGAGQLGEGAGLELVRGEVAYVRVGVGGTGGGHHLLHGAVEKQILLAHGEGERGERIVVGSLPGHRRPASHGPPTRVRHRSRRTPGSPLRHLPGRRTTAARRPQPRRPWRRWPAGPGRRR
ncbi:hypothetical protein SFR_5135 [Streptomyces sp. FR-008]|nr:hypothetical protein SFR_5135 [Streptomyces sp. FR-008]